MVCVCLFSGRPCYAPVRCLSPGMGVIVVELQSRSDVSCEDFESVACTSPFESDQ